MGHSPPTTLATYTQVIRELKNCRRSPLLSKIDQARAARGRMVDVEASG
jgi:hypothetical protein